MDNCNAPNLTLVPLLLQRRAVFPRYQWIVGLVGLAVALVCLGLMSEDKSLLVYSRDEHSRGLVEKDLDARMQLAAVNVVSTLKGREGTVIVMDPHTGRIRAMWNRQLAFEKTFAPGSTIKPFVTLAAMRAHLINSHSRILCPGSYSNEDFRSACSHPQHLPPLNSTEALAHSCNHFFGTVGERLGSTVFNSTLTEFGFGERTGTELEDEVVGKLPRGPLEPKTALGEGDRLLVTPIQLIVAYSALVNGGQLLKPAFAVAQGFAPRKRHEIILDQAHRETIIEGLRGAVRYGTAASSGLNSLPLYTFGKTGTATQLGGFRTDGWFIGFAAQPGADDPKASPAAPENVKLAVLVIVRRAHGSDAAEMARPIFEAFASNHHPTHTATDLSNSSSPLSSAQFMRVHLVKENITRTISLEDYVTGVVATEGSMEQEQEAMKALAVVVRTYALRNRGRHAGEGYDFCSTTHCQRYKAVTSRETSSVVEQAVRSTEGEVLLTSNNQIADSYFGASCGGATANLNSLWGVAAPPHLRGVDDDFCVDMPHGRWQDVISKRTLLRGLNSDARSRVGNRLENLVVTRRDATGRAQSIRIEGQQIRTVSGWDFKIIVGRALGWNLIKSSRFEINRHGSDFVFRGSGFGHGLGLCQEGSHVMARRGAVYRQVLAKYFPGTLIDNYQIESSSLDLVWNGDLPVIEAQPQTRNLQSMPVSRRRIAAEHVRLNYPSNIARHEAEQLLKIFESSLTTLLRRLSYAKTNVQLSGINVYLNSTTGDFVGRTGQPYWAAAATKGTNIDLQPLGLLKSRRILETTIRHELVHALVNTGRGGPVPRWLEEGLALYLSNEGPLLAKYATSENRTPDQLEVMLKRASTADEMGQAYAAAFREVGRMIRTEGEVKVWQRALGHL